MATISLDFKTNITKRQAENIETLSTAIERLGKAVENAKGIDIIANAISKLNGIKVNKTLGENLTSVVDAMNTLKDVKDITDSANNINNGFAIIAQAVKHFEGIAVAIPTTLGKSVSELVGAINSISSVNDISNHAENINKGLEIIANAMSHFNDITVKIPPTIGKSVTSLIEAINGISNVGDILSSAENINRGFETIAIAVLNFDKITPKIPTTLGKSVTGLIDAINNINSVKDISDSAENINRGFETIAISVLNFENVAVNIPSTLGKTVTGLIEAINGIDNVKDISESAENINKSFEIISTAMSHFNNLAVKIPVSLGDAITSLVDSINKISNVNDIVSSAQSINNGFAIIAEAVTHFEDVTVKIPKALGETILGLVNAINGINNVNDITDSANNIYNGFAIIAKAVSYFEGVTANISTSLVKSIKELIEVINDISYVQDITDIANNIYNGFEIIAKAVSYFEGVTVNISTSLGKSVSGLVEAINNISSVNDISGSANEINNGFAIIAQAVSNFYDVAVKIPTTLGKSTAGLVEAINNISSVNDISASAKNLDTGFSAIAKAVSHFEGIAVKIPVTLGKGVAGIVDAINTMGKIRDLSKFAERLDKNFEIIANAVSHFDGLENANYSGIAKLVLALNSVGKIKPINNTVIKNAKKLAEAINVLDAAVTADTARLEALAPVIKKLNTSFNSAKAGASGFSKALSMINFAAFISLAKSAVNAIQQLFSKLNYFVAEYGNLQNSLTFFEQSLEGQSSRIGKIVGAWADLGLVDFSQFTNQIAKTNQILRGYGVSAENAATMSLNFAQLATDMSYALGKNGEDIDAWNQRMISILTGQTRAGYMAGVDITVKALDEALEKLNIDMDETTNQMSKAEKAMLIYKTVMSSTTEVQGQFSREINTTYVQLTILKNRFNVLKQSIGKALAPLFLQFIKWGLIALQVIIMVINAVSKLFGGQTFELINFSQIGKDMANYMDDTASGATNVADGLEDAVDEAKELKKTISAIDQVFTINDSISSDAASSIGDIGNIDFGELPTYDFITEAAMEDLQRMFDGIDQDAQKVYDTLEKIAPVALGIAAALAGWKIASSFIDGLNKIKGLFGDIKTPNLSLGIEWKAAGFALLLSDISDFVDYFKDFRENGATFDNVVGMLGNFAGGLGDVFLIFGNLKVAGVLKIIDGLAEVVGALSNISQNGVNIQNVLNLINGLSDIAIGIGLLNKNMALVGGGLIVKGLVDIIGELSSNWEAIKNGDWSGVDKVKLIVGAIEVLAGIFLTISGIKDIFSTTKKAKDVVSTAASGASAVTAAGSGMSNTGKNAIKAGDIIKYAAAGIAIIAGAIAIFAFEIGVLGLFDNSIFINGRDNAKAIGEALLGLILPIGLIIAGAIGIGIVVKGTNGIGMLAIQEGLAVIAETIAVMAVEIGVLGLFDNSIFVNGKNNAQAIGDALMALELPIGLIVAGSLAIGSVIAGTGGIGILAIEAGFAIIVEVMGVMAFGVYKIGEFDNSIFVNGKDNAQAIGDALSRLEKPIGIIIAASLAIGGVIVGTGGIGILAIEAGLATIVKVVDVIGKAIAQFDTEVKGIDPGVVEMAAISGKTLMELANNLPTNGGIIYDFFTGGKWDEERMYDFMKNMGRSIKVFGDEIKGINNNSIENAAITAKTLMELANNLPTKGGIIYDFFTGGKWDEERMYDFMRNMGKSVKAFGDEIKGLDSNAVANAATAAKTLMKLADNLPTNGGIIYDFFTGGKWDEERMYDFMRNMGKAVKAFGDEIEGVDGDAITNAATAAKTLMELAKHLPTDQTWTSTFLGTSVWSNEKISDYMKNLGKSVKVFGDEIDGVDSDAIANAATAAKTLMELAKNLPTDQTWTSTFLGTSVWSNEKISDYMINMGKSVKAFGDEIEGMDINAASNAANIGKTLVELSKNLPTENSTLLGWFNGKVNISTFGTDIVSFGTSIKKFADVVSGINVEDINNATAAAKALVDLSENLPTSDSSVVGWFNGKTDFSEFGEQIVSFGTSMKSFATDISGIDTSKVESTMSIAKFISELNLSENDNLSILSTGIKDFGEAISSFNTSISSINQANIEKLPKLIEKIINDFKSFDFDETKDNIQNAMQTSLEKIDFEKLSNIILNGLNNANFEKYDNVGKNIAKEINNGLNTYKHDFSTLGNNIKLALETAVKEKHSTAVSNIAKAIETGLNNYKFNLAQLGTNIKNSLITAVNNLGNLTASEITSKIQSGINNFSFNLSSFETNIKNSLTNATSNLGNIIATSIATKLQSGLNGFTFNLGTVGTNMKSSLETNATTLGNAMANAIAAEITLVLNDYVFKLAQLGTNIRNSLITAVTDIGSLTATETADELAETLNIYTFNIEQFGTNISNSLTTVTSNLGNTIASGIASKLQSGINGFTFDLTQFNSNLKSKMNTDYSSVGTNIAAGVARGINNYYPDLSQWINRLKQGMTVSFKISSPSKWSEDFVGKFLAEGVDEGLNNYDPNVAQYSQSLKNALLTGTKEAETTVAEYQKNMNAASLSASGTVNSEYINNTENISDAIAEQTRLTTTMLNTLIEAVNASGVIELDGEKLTQELGRRLNREQSLRTMTGRFTS